MLVLEVEHWKAHIEVLGFGTHVMRTAVGTRPPILEKVNDEASANAGAHDEAANTRHCDEI